MKRILTALFFTGILISCNSSDKTKAETQDPATTETETKSTSNDVNTNYKTIDTDEALIATSLMAAPKESRSKCKVIGYNMAGEFVTLREGDNEFIVLADDPKKEGFSAACYHKDLEPFMARGRALRSEGKTEKEIFEMREVEMKAGQLKIAPGLTLNVYSGKKSMYNPETSKVEDAKLRYVVYMPWATSESTGLPEAPVASNHPWLMDPGTHRAHIMISPLPEDKK